MNAQAQQGAETMTAESLRSGKTGADENFPVASVLIAAPLRPVILAFYDFVRSGDDVADNPALAPAQKHALLDQLEIPSPASARPNRSACGCAKNSASAASPTATPATCSTPSAATWTSRVTPIGTN